MWEGLAAFQAGDYRIAVERFESAYSREPNADVLFNLARSHGRLGECDVAHRKVQMYLAEVATPPPEFYEGLTELETDCPGSTRLRAAQTNGTRDAAGGHAGHPRPTRVAALGASNPAVRTAPSVGDTATSDAVAVEPWAYGLLAVGGISAAASVTYAVMALNTKRELEELSESLVADPSRTWDEAAGPSLREQRRQGDMALTFGVAALLLETAGVLLLLEPWKDEQPSARRRALQSVKVRSSENLVWCGYEGQL